MQYLGITLPDMSKTGEIGKAGAGRCDKGHELKATDPEQLKTEHPGYATGYLCNGCGDHREGVVSHHCSECNYDLCPDCHQRATSTKTCPGKHGLKEFETPSAGYGCDLCKERFSADTHMYGCRICNYDVCDDCWDKFDAAAVTLADAEPEREREPESETEAKMSESPKEVYRPAKFDVTFTEKNGLNLFDLAMKYELGPLVQMYLGRKLDVDVEEMLKEYKLLKSGELKGEDAKKLNPALLKRNQTIQDVMQRKINERQFKIKWLSSDEEEMVRDLGIVFWLCSPCIGMIVVIDIIMLIYQQGDACQSVNDAPMPLHAWMMTGSLCAISIVGCWVLLLWMGLCGMCKGGTGETLAACCLVCGGGILLLLWLVWPILGIFVYENMEQESMHGRCGETVLSWIILKFILIGFGCCAGCCYCCCRDAMSSCFDCLEFCCSADDIRSCCEWCNDDDDSDEEEESDDLEVGTAHKDIVDDEREDKAGSTGNEAAEDGTVDDGETAGDENTARKAADIDLQDNVHVAGDDTKGAVVEDGNASAPDGAATEMQIMEAKGTEVQATVAGGNTAAGDDAKENVDGSTQVQVMIVDAANDDNQVPADDDEAEVQ